MKKQTLKGAGFAAASALYLAALPIAQAQPPTRTIGTKQTLTTSGAQVAAPAYAALRGTLKADKKTLKAGEVVTFTYAVTNTSKTIPQTVRFSSGQRFDIMVSTKGSTASVWQMSQTMRYIMSLGSVTFAPGETKTFTGTWRPDNGMIKPGTSFTATAYLTAMGAGQSATTARPASAVVTFSAAPK